MAGQDLPQIGRDTGRRGNVSQLRHSKDTSAECDCDCVSDCNCDYNTTGTASSATTPLTANGGTTIGGSGLAVVQKDIQQRNHLLKMPTTTTKTTLETRIEKPTITANAITTTTTTTKSSSGGNASWTLRILAKCTGRSSSSVGNPISCLLFSALILGVLVGSGQAGFACLSNPCVFGVCIDGLNRWVVATFWWVRY